MIEVTKFQKAYADQIAVNGLSFSVAAGEVLGLIGPNGAGKTTTLRALTGIIPPGGGQLSVDGNDVCVSPIAVKKVTYYVPDDPQLFNDLTIEQHFSFTASVYGIADWQTEMDNWLDRFDLAEKLHTRAADLSRGMRQKLAICCAYLCRPKALLLDEPMTGLDPRGIRVLKETISEQANAGAAIVISSHLLAMVEDICSHVLILHKGQKKFHGTLEDLKRQFATHKRGTLEEIFFEAVEGQQPVFPKVELPSLRQSNNFSEYL